MPNIKHFPISKLETQHQVRGLERFENIAVAEGKPLEDYSISWLEEARRRLEGNLGLVNEAINRKQQVTGQIGERALTQTTDLPPEYKESKAFR